MIIAIATISLSQVVVWKLYNLLWPCFTGFCKKILLDLTDNNLAVLVSFFSTIIILVMPKSSYQSEYGLLPKSVVPLCSIIALQFHIVLVSTLMNDVWPGIVFWFGVGEQLIKQNKLNVFVTACFVGRVPSFLEM
jgi:hypothetical protein